MRWQIKVVYHDAETPDGVSWLGVLLADGWEPFAVTTLTGAEKVWLRKPE